MYAIQDIPDPTMRQVGKYNDTFITGDMVVQIDASAPTPPANRMTRKLTLRNTRTAALTLH